MLHLDADIIRALCARVPALARLAAAEPQIWLNPGLGPAAEELPQLPLGAADVDEAEARLRRFAPFLARRFPETAAQGGLIESPLTELPRLHDALEEGGPRSARLLLKRDSDLPVAGSIKARGGIYEVLCHAEELALEGGLLHEGDDYAALDSDGARRFFSRYTVQVGSTGNLGLSIGMMSAAFGFRAVVHMSADARAWKKALLRSHGVDVREYAGDYGAAVAEGRALSDADPASYFVDDESSRRLFLGYAVAARRLRPQLEALGALPDGAHPLFVWLPCGVGGAPGGVAFGLKLAFGDDVHCFLAEPVQAPCMLAGLASGLHSAVCVQDFGLSGLTEADGLAVGRPSGFVGRLLAPLLAGEITLADGDLFAYLRALTAHEGLFVEPSACAAFAGPARFLRSPEGERYLAVHGLRAGQITHLAWATGGALVPAEERARYQITELR